MTSNGILKTSAVVLVLGSIATVVLLQRDEKPKLADSGVESPATVQERSRPVHSSIEHASPKSAGVKKATAASNAAEDVIANTPADFGVQIRSVLKGEVSEDEQLAFWQAVKAGNKLDSLIGELQQTTSAAENDVESRLTLGLAYVAKIWSMPDGPEKAIWAGKAEGVWKEVLAVEPQNWEAQRNIAFSYSRYPDFLNKTGDAIAEYERTLAIQEAAPVPREDFAESYLEMARLQVKTGDPVSALSTLERGATAHPDNALITRQLDTIRRSYQFEAPQE